MTRPITSLDPLAHRAAIDALDAQRAAYQRYARLVEAQQRVLNDGDADKVVAFTQHAALELAGLEDGAAALPPLVARATAGLSADGLQEMRRRLDALAHDARHAEAAIRNLTVQLEAWRDAFARQLSEAGIGVGGEAPPSGDGYAQPGFGRSSGGAPHLIDRRG
jgi:hypothetical protein